MSALARLGGHLLALVCVTVAAWLGFWQLDAWQERREAEAVDLTRLEPVALTEVLGPDDAFPGEDVGRPVAFSGTWVPEGTVYVEGRQGQGVDGYWVVTPLAVGSSRDAPALPVVRGWVASPDDAPPVPDESADLVAWLQPTEGTGEPDPDPDDDVLQQVRTADLIRYVDQDLYGAYAVADHSRSQSAHGFDGLAEADLAELPESGRFTALRNLLYGIEWWVFGAFAAFVWWRWARDTRHSRRLVEESGPEEAVDHRVPS